ncbi:MAG: quinone-dependent dihydroorotate dehydrogenase [Cytophagales bacterium]|nr:MAG: quinone-dependent dihydroorotate dehydrogenase [Cytophagales bacterium]
MYKNIFKPFLFLFNPEKAHHLAFLLLKYSLKIPFSSSFCRFLFDTPHQNINFLGLNFKNRIGLAAGFDKNGAYIDELACLGFGFIEVGTVTPLAQQGNDQPRLFRLFDDEAIINRMGFNNLGMEELVKKLKSRKTDIIIGGNIGKNKQTPIEKSNNDYLLCFESLYAFVDYFVVNVSSPNTPNLRQLQDKEPLMDLLTEIYKSNDLLAQKYQQKRKPVLLKIAPDLTDSQLDDIIDIIKTTKTDGIVATNTTISRDNLKTNTKEIQSIGNGGLSGKPLKNNSTYIIKYITEKSNKSIPIIGVGGIYSAQDAQEKIDAGASLVQVYSGFVYEGPDLVKEIALGLK